MLNSFTVRSILPCTQQNHSCWSVTFTSDVSSVHSTLSINTRQIPYNTPRDNSANYQSLAHACSNSWCSLIHRLQGQLNETLRELSVPLVTYARTYARTYAQCLTTACTPVKDLNMQHRNNDTENNYLIEYFNSEKTGIIYKWILKWQNSEVEF